MSSPIAILGGGIAGLVLARRLHERGVAFELFEASSEFGGMARTLRHGAFGVDTGAHRFHDKDPEITAWTGALLDGAWHKSHKRSAILKFGRCIEFPLSPLNVLRNVPLTRGMRYAWDFVFRSRGEPSNFRDHALTRFGGALAEDFVLQYSRKLWGVPLETLSLELGTGRLKNLSLATVLKEMCFGERKKHEHLDGSFYYPRGGYGRITDALLAGLPSERLHANCAITALARADSGYRVATAQGERAFAAVAGALPLPKLCAMADWVPESARSQARKLKHRHLVNVFVMLNRPEVSPHASLYVPDSDCLVTRVHEPKQRCPSLAPAEQTSLLAEVPLDDATAAQTATRVPAVNRLRDETVAALARLGLYKKDEVLGAEAHVISNAYPCITLESLEQRRAAVAALEAPGDFYCLGRSARFEYTHLHQIFREAFSLADRLCERSPAVQPVAEA